MSPAIEMRPHSSRLSFCGDVNTMSSSVRGHDDVWGGVRWCCFLLTKCQQMSLTRYGVHDFLHASTPTQWAGGMLFYIHPVVFRLSHPPVQNNSKVTDINCNFIKANGLASIFFHWSWLLGVCGWRKIIIGLDNGLAPNRRQTIIWTKDDPVQFSTYAALWGTWVNSSQGDSPLKGLDYFSPNSIFLSDATTFVMRLATMEIESELWMQMDW